MSDDGTELFRRRVYQIISVARRLIDKKESWIAGGRSFDKAGLPCSPDSSEAVCWDIKGAVSHAAYNYRLGPFLDADAREEALSELQGAHHCCMHDFAVFYGHQAACRLMDEWLARNQRYKA